MQRRPLHAPLHACTLRQRSHEAGAGRGQRHARLWSGQHAGLHAVGTDVAQHRLNLLSDEGRGRHVHRSHTLGVLPGGVGVGRS